MAAIPMTDLDEQKPSRRLWVFAAATAFVLHVGGAALALAHLKTDDSEEPLGTPAIEIGLELSSARTEATDLPVGPDTEASVASPALTEQKAELKEQELPKDVPTETADPDRVVTAEDSNKPKEEDSKASAAQTASIQSEAAEATAAPNVEAAPIGRSQAPVQGVGKALQRLKSSWIAELSAHFDRHKRNPPLQKFRDAKVILDVTFDRTGHVVSSRVAQSSGDPAYDEAALAMLRRSDPVPRPPALVADEGLHYTLPVIFRVDDRG
jgi:TonB family protein